MLPSEFRDTKMKILLVIDYYQPQLGYSEKHIVEQLVKQGHQVQVLTSNRYFPFPDYSASAGKILGPRILKAGSITKNGVKIIRQPVQFEIFARAIFTGHQEVLQSFKPDVVIVNKVAGFHSVRLAQLKSQFGYKLVSYDSHLPSEFYRENVGIKRLIYGSYAKLFGGILNSKVDKFVAVQEGTIEIMKDFYGVKKNIEYIPLGTDIDQFRFDKKQRLLLRTKYRIKNKDFVIIYTGKIVEAKGVDLLFKAFGELIKLHSDIKLVLIGDGVADYKQKCLSLVPIQNHNSIIFAGFQKNDDLYKFYSMSDVGVWPLQESTAMNDAAACSLVFIANDQIGTKTRVSMNNALLYKKDNVDDLTKKIEYLYSHADERKQMGQRGRQLVEAKLSWAKIAQQYIQFK